MSYMSEEAMRFEQEKAEFARMKIATSRNGHTFIRKRVMPLSFGIAGIVLGKALDYLYPIRDANGRVQDVSEPKY